MEKIDESVNQEIATPQPPLLKLEPKKPNSKQYFERMKNKEEFKGCQEDELKNKYQLTEVKDEKTALEDEATEIKILPNLIGKIQCKRCESYFFPEEINAHYLQHSSQILEWLYLGSCQNASNEKELTVRTNISCIVNCAYEVLNYFPEQFQYLKIDCEDDENETIDKFFKETSEFICLFYLLQVRIFIDQAKQSNKNVLVHCIQGISRSTTIILAYLMKYENMNLFEACQLVLEKRSIAKPNKGFLKQLMLFEQEIQNKQSIPFIDLEILFKKQSKQFN